jgi:transcriptional regulator with XRE-family HTH domain
MIKQEDFLKRVGQNIQTIRINRGIESIDIANKLFLTLKAIDGIEAGLVSVTLIDLLEIANALGVEPAELVK